MLSLIREIDNSADYKEAAIILQQNETAFSIA